jgi:16S rRNA (adenine1518-N6/adenine1519-N6)-dimethyltransferase
LRPRKSLGQNFLKDHSYLRRIVDALELAPYDEVLEIGPGTGVLTAALLKVARRVVAVELDPHLIAALRKDFSGSANLDVVHGDALQIDPGAYFAVSYKLAGNIPYYITGPILRHYLELPQPPEIMVLMVQREVAERIVARPGEMSLLAVSVQFYGFPSVVARVPRRAFHPAPKVDSAIVKIVPRPSPLNRDRRDDFFRLARAGFSTRRKTLENALRMGLGISRDEARGLLAAADIDSTRRAETLSVDDWVRLTEAFGRAGVD